MSSCDWFKHWQLACIQPGLKYGPLAGVDGHVSHHHNEGAVWLKQTLISTGIEKTELCNVVHTV